MLCNSIYFIIKCNIIYSGRYVIWLALTLYCFIVVFGALIKQIVVRICVRIVLVVADVFCIDWTMVIEIIEELASFKMALMQLSFSRCVGVVWRLV